MGKIDCGHYVEAPIVSGELSVHVEKGKPFRSFHVLQGEKNKLPFESLELSEGAFAEICFIVMPGTNADIPLTVDLTGEEAQINISAAYLCGASEKVSISTDIRHRMPNCISDQLIKGLAGGSSHAFFNGRIVVAPDAQKTEAYQANHNVILSDKARVDTKPQLEIYADDVKCSHGATIGALNEDERFYMRSRGITEDEAKLLQMISFISPVLEKIPDGYDKENIIIKVSEAIKHL